MKTRLFDLWTRLGAKTNPDNAFVLLSASYNQPHRFYHNFDHIKTCLDEFQEVRHLTSNPTIVEFAIWYHDVVYDVKSKDNEELSARIACNTWAEAGLPQETAQKIHDLVLATKHDGPVHSTDQKLITDIDLAILGRPVEEFDAYENNIRKEYSHVPEKQFRTGRAAILKNFLNKQTLYSTDYFIAKYQHQAVVNLTRSIKMLGS